MDGEDDVFDILYLYILDLLMDSRAQGKSPRQDYRGIHLNFNVWRRAWFIPITLLAEFIEWHKIYQQCIQAHHG